MVSSGSLSINPLPQVFVPHASQCIDRMLQKPPICNWRCDFNGHRASDHQTAAEHFHSPSTHNPPVQSQHHIPSTWKARHVSILSSMSSHTFHYIVRIVFNSVNILLSHAQCHARLYPPNNSTQFFHRDACNVRYTGKSLCALSFAPALSPATCNPRAR